MLIRHLKVWLCDVTYGGIQLFFAVSRGVILKIILR